MAYVPSHQELRDHPKTRKAARKAEVSLPAMIGHLHLLWWWALDHAPDGDLGKYDADDLADAALWEGDPEAFIKALRDCGPGGTAGFLDDGGKLHDWDDYGGKYGQRVASARKAAAARWQSPSNATAMPAHSDRTATASPPQCDDDAGGNAEKRRVEEIREEKARPRKRATQVPDDWKPDPPLLAALAEKHPRVDLLRELEKFRNHHGAKGSTFKDIGKAYRNWIAKAEEFGNVKGAGAPNAMVDERGEEIPW